MRLCAIAGDSGLLDAGDAGGAGDAGDAGDASFVLVALRGTTIFDTDTHKSQKSVPSHIIVLCVHSAI